jgi:carboxylesterase type B
MVLFGQSAGGASVDFYSYSYTKDPIVHGIIPQSGTAGLASRTSSSTSGTSNTSNTAVTNWSNLSQKLGCGTVTAEDVTKTLACMRSKDVEAILNATVPSSSATAVGTWGPKYDAKTVFADTSAKAAKGDFIKVVSGLANHTNLCECS